MKVSPFYFASTILIVAVAGAALAATPSAPSTTEQTAKEAQANASTGSPIGEPPQIAANIEQERLAKDLAAYATSRSDPLAMIVAASIAKSLRGGPAAASKKDGKVVHTTLGDQLVAQARQMAKGRKDLLPLIEDVEAKRTRGISCYAHNQGGGSFDWYGPTPYIAESAVMRYCVANSWGLLPCIFDGCD